MDHAAHAGGQAGLEETAGALDVRLLEQVTAAPVAHPGGGVDDDVLSPDGAGERTAVAEVAAPDLHTGGAQGRSVASGADQRAHALATPRRARATWPPRKPVAPVTSTSSM